MVRNWRRRDLLIAASAAIALPPLALLGSAAATRPARGEGTASSPEIRFEDLAGNEIVLPAPAQRIVDLWTTGAGFAIAAHGSPSRLVGVNAYAHSVFEQGLIGRLYPESLAIPSDVMTGNAAPNIERLVNLDPDIVVDMRDDPRDLSATMKDAGLTVARYGQVEGGNRGIVEALLLMFGRMIGDTSRADRIIAVMDATLGRLATVRSLPHSARPKVLLLMPFGERFYVSGGGAGGLYSDFIYAAGGVNAAEAFPGVSEATAEQIAAWNPEVMLIFQSEGASPAVIYDHPILGGVDAAGAGRVHVVPIGANNWGSLGPDEFLSQVWLAELLYPNLLERKLRQDMLRAYDVIFDRTFSDDELDDVLRIDINGGSNGYARFFRDA